MKLAKDGFSVIVTMLILSALLAAAGIFAPIPFWASYILYAIAGFFTLFTLYFFRDPERNIPEVPNSILCPADGKVIVNKEIDFHHYFDGPARQLSIFLSPLDVHVNRVPVSGKIDYAKYFPGKYLVAWHEKASELNERSEFGVIHSSGNHIFFNQITGYIARRITYDLSLGDEIKAGYKFGMMKFGSRMDIIVPRSITFDIAEGTTVVGGETILAEIQ
jgi:phosphatidylserine decarboxylase